MGLFDAIAKAGDTITNLGWNIGSTLYNNNQAKIARRDAQRWEKEMAEWQNEKNLEFWQMNNEYNTPANQMKRFQEAGLNPHLIYGNGTSSAGNSSSPVSSSRPGTVDFARPLLDPSRNPLAGSFDAVVAMRNLDNQTMLAASQADYNRARQRDAEAAASLKDVQSLRELFKYGIDKDVRDALVAQHFANVANTRANTWSTEAQGFLSHQRVKESIANTELLQSKLKLQPLEAALLNQRIRETIASAVSKEFINDLNVETREDLIRKIESVANDALYRSENGRLDMEIKKIDQEVYEVFGKRPGDSSEKALVGSLYNILRNVRNSINSW